MTSFGKNMKITVDKKHRDTTRRLFTEVLGCTVKNPTPDMEVYAFDDGFGIGAQYVEPSQALEAADHDKAPWLELLVPDPAAAQAQLAALGVKPFDYTDTAHSYYRAPGGPIFRLAKRP